MTSRRDLLRGVAALPLAAPFARALAAARESLALERFVFDVRFAESGAMNSLVHQWVYEDAADRAKRRAGMMADPDWQSYLKKLNESGLLVEQATSLMVPAKFMKMKK